MNYIICNKSYELHDPCESYRLTHMDYVVRMNYIKINCHKIYYLNLHSY